MKKTNTGKETTPYCSFPPPRLAQVSARDSKPSSLQCRKVQAPAGRSERRVGTPQEIGLLPRSFAVGLRDRPIRRRRGRKQSEKTRTRVHISAPAHVLIACTVDNRCSATNFAKPPPRFASEQNCLFSSSRGVSRATAMDGAVALLSLALSSLFLAPSLAQTACQSYAFSDNRVYASCVDLPVLSSYLHWNYSETSYVADIAFRVTGATSSDWVSWAINPSGLEMVGSQALVAYQNSSGSMWAYTSSVDSFGTTLSPGSLSFGVTNISAVLEGSEMTIFATLQLSSGMTTVNQVWQVGPMDNGSPRNAPDERRQRRFSWDAGLPVRDHCGEQRVGKLEAAEEECERPTNFWN
ncbi:hypothetical protein NL676_017713 [Syzygium grande]|nr:hypothetical protein NL676_017713 [Syzygium grande]